ncbi:MAG TPA: YciI family protein [Bacteroidia bacterium]|jgi:hypothetical protein|nr:YciI family protein [Bacteroidia bacterium]
MKEYMFFIRKSNNSEQTLSSEKHQAFLKGCETYIGKLKAEGRLVSAQPIIWEGKIISGNDMNWEEDSITQNGEVLGGYYHILANDMAEAISIAKQNPEFEYNEGTRIEVRPLKMKEAQTGFVYPAK